MENRTPGFVGSLKMPAFLGCFRDQSASQTTLRRKLPCNFTRLSLVCSFPTKSLILRVPLVKAFSAILFLKILLYLRHAVRKFGKIFLFFYYLKIKTSIYLLIIFFQYQIIIKDFFNILVQKYLKNYQLSHILTMDKLK